MATDTITAPTVSTVTPPPRYWAFISYSHRDRQWGDWLHRSLETYRVPKALVSSGAPARVFPCFATARSCPVRSISAPGSKPLWRNPAT